jgi:hypothetical protein
VQLLDGDRPAEALGPATQAVRIVQTLLGNQSAYLHAQQARLRALVALRDPAAPSAVRAALADAGAMRLFADAAALQGLLGELSAHAGRHDEALGLYFPALRALQGAAWRPAAATVAQRSAGSLATLGRHDEARTQLALARSLTASFLPEGHRHLRALDAELAALAPS